jgi:2-iminobutanoate/2-iminopropanoate deaminase
MEEREMKQRLLNAVLATLFAGLLCLPLSAYAQGKRVIAGGEGLPFSDGIVAGKMLFVSGQQGTDSQGKLKSDTIEAQTQATLENIGRVVKQAGFQLNDIVAVNVYLADIHDFAAMNGVYKKFMPSPKPTRTTVQVAGLVNGARIELSVIAVKP